MILILITKFNFRDWRKIDKNKMPKNLKVADGYFTTVL
jgi:hypothetical protein